jgi:type 1 glutamine amidotransferase
MQASRRLQLLRVLSRLLVCLFLCATAATADEPLRICLVSGSIEYKSNDTLAEFQKFVESNYEARCSRAFQQGSDEEHLPGLEQLETCDVALLFTRRLRLSGDELRRIRDYCLAGKPIVGVRTASHGVQTWLEFDKDVLGGDYQGHYGVGPVTKIAVTSVGRKHPILSGFEPFESAGSLYKNPRPSADVEVLLTGTADDHSEPIAWTRQYKGARVFYTSLGHMQDFENASFRRLLARALFWTADREPQERARR